MVAGLVYLLLRNHRLAQPAGGLGDERQRHDRGPGQVVPGLLVADVQQLVHAPGRGQHGERALHVDPDVAGVHRDRVRLGRRQAGRELVVDQQAPHVPVGDVADKFLDVDAPVPECAAFLVWLGDLRLECDDALKPRHKVGHSCFLRLLVSGRPRAGRGFRPPVGRRGPAGLGGLRPYSTARGLRTGNPAWLIGPGRPAGASAWRPGAECERITTRGADPTREPVRWLRREPGRAPPFRRSGRVPRPGRDPG